MLDVAFFSFESTACDRNNTLYGFTVLVIGILCDGMKFEFFSFDAKWTNKFSRGCLLGDPLGSRRGLKLVDFSKEGSAGFIAGLRQICEIVFDLLEGAYVACLTAFCVARKAART